MEEERNNSWILVILGLGIVAVVCISIGLFIKIWTSPVKTKPVKDTEKYTNKIGTYKSETTVSLDSQIKSYLEEICLYVSNSDVNWIYDHTNDEYLSYKKIDKNGLKTYLEKAGILGSHYYMEKYATTTYNNSKIIVIWLAEIDNSSQTTIVIREYAPNKYSISFEDFIGYNSKQVTKEYSGLKVIVNEQVLFRQSIKMKVSIKNTSDTIFTLNAKKEYEMFTLVFSDNTTTKPVIGTSIGMAIGIEPNKTLNYSLDFDILNFRNIKYSTLKLNSVKNQFSSSVEDIEIKF